MMRHGIEKHKSLLQFKFEDLTSTRLIFLEVTCNCLNLTDSEVTARKVEIQESGWEVLAEACTLLQRIHLLVRFFWFAALVDVRMVHWLLHLQLRMKGMEFEDELTWSLPSNPPPSP